MKIHKLITEHVAPMKNCSYLELWINGPTTNRPTEAKEQKGGFEGRSWWVIGILLEKRMWKLGIWKEGKKEVGRKKRLSHMQHKECVERVEGKQTSSWISLALKYEMEDEYAAESWLC